MPSRRVHLTLKRAALTLDKTRDSMRVSVIDYQRYNSRFGCYWKCPHFLLPFSVHSSTSRCSCSFNEGGVEVQQDTSPPLSLPPSLLLLHLLLFLRPIGIDTKEPSEDATIFFFFAISSFLYLYTLLFIFWVCVAVVVAAAVAVIPCNC